jgi:hypothetical protein
VWLEWVSGDARLADARLADARLADAGWALGEPVRGVSRGCSCLVAQAMTCSVLQKNSSTVHVALRPARDAPVAGLSGAG